jgi:GNAT superfamily N-acetyltransferase
VEEADSTLIIGVLIIAIIEHLTMQLGASLVPSETIRPLRELYRQEMNCQILHDSWHGRGWTDSYLLTLNGHTVGYAAIGGVRADPKDTSTEFFVLPIHRGAALPLFRRLIEVSQAKKIESQTNDLLLTLMLFDCASTIERHAVMFDAGFTTNLVVPGATFRRTAEAEKGRIFPHSTEPIGDWLIESDGQIVATGGILFHYNIPYGDIYMEVAELSRKCGFGSFLVQELKRTAYETGKIPAARCNATNAASRATLQKAGMLPCARVLVGMIGTFPPTS